MKRELLLFLLVSFSVTGTYAQVVPKSSLLDGIILQQNNENLASWKNSSLAVYQTGSPSPGNYGTYQPPPLTPLVARTMRIIYLGDTAQDTLQVGYRYDSRDSYILEGCPPSFGAFADINLAYGEAPQFDFFVQKGDDTLPLLQPSAEVHWCSEPLWVSTFIPSLLRYEPVETWVAVIGERDTAGLVYPFAIQVFYPEGTPLVAVPEPAYMGVLGTLALLGIAVFRRRRRVK